MGKWHFKSTNLIFSSIVITLIWVIAGFFAFQLMFSTAKINEISQKDEIIYKYESALEKYNNSMESLYGFTSVLVPNMTIDEFNEYSEILLQKESSIINISIAPNGIQEFVYPLEGNEGVLGHDLLNDVRANVRSDVLSAIRTELTIISGPYQDRNDETRKIIVFRKALKSNDEFWGIVNVVVDTDELFAEVKQDQDIYDVSILTNIGEVLSGPDQESNDITTLGNYNFGIQLGLKDSYRTKYVSRLIAGGFVLLVALVTSLYSYITYRKKSQVLETEIEKMIYYDYLSDLPNRRALAKDFKKYVSNGFSLIFADIDNFKFLNDLHGHNKGDLALIDISTRIKTVLEDRGTLYRWGGDEFVIIVPSVDVTTLEVICNELLSALNKPFTIDENEFSLSVSMGAVTDAQKHESIDMAISKADSAMYQVKIGGKNSFSVFEEHSGNILEEDILYDQLTRTIDLDKETDLYLQPIIDVSTNEVDGYELLLRIFYKNQYISPAKFIKTAESNGTIEKIDNHVLCKAITYLDSLSKDKHISVNISGLNLTESFLKTIEQTCLNNNVETNRINIEVTENVSLISVPESKKVIQKLIALGFGVHLDDFGTGYSSLHYLATLQMSAIKIDKAFIKDDLLITELQILKSTIALGRSMGIKVIAEGVETEKQLLLLKDLGCDYYQGYLFSKAVPLKEIKEKYES